MSSIEKQEQNNKLDHEIQGLRPWMTFHGWIYLILGVFYCISIFGVVIGVPLIIAGVGLINSNSEFGNFLNSKSNLYLEGAIKGQKQFFLTTGILFLISFGLPILIFVSLILTFAFNPSINKDINVQINKIQKMPQLQKPNRTYDLGKGKEV